MTLLVTHDACLAHQTPSGHPECSDRLIAITQHLQSTDIWSSVALEEAPAISTDEIEIVHGQELFDALVNAEPEAGFARIDADTMLSNGSIEAVKRAVGATVRATEAVLEGEDTTAFALVRPPGHHAERNVPMGFCIFNSVAIACEVALKRIKRVAILDFDVHHCNGTVEIFQNRPDVMVCSTFQHPFYPNRFQDTGAYGDNIVNCPLATNSGSGEFRDAVDSYWLPKLARFEPDLVLISAGFDAHEEDPLGQLNLTNDDYQWVTERAIEVARDYSNGRIASTLEGGYNLEVVGSSVEAHLATMLSA